MTVIDFKTKVEEIMDEEDVTLSTFKLTERDVDLKELYQYIDKKYKIKIIEEDSGKEEWGVRILGRNDLFEELTRVATEYESERVAWIVLDRKLEYLYIKELDQKYKAEKGRFKNEVKQHLYGYGIDYLMLLQRIGNDVYRWVAS